MNVNPSLLTAAGREAGLHQVVETGNAVAAHIGGDWAAHRQVQVHPIPYVDQAGHQVSTFTLRLQATHDATPVPLDAVLAVPIILTGSTPGAEGVAPIFLGQPADVTVASGEGAVLSVVVASGTPVQYQWYRLISTNGVYSDVPIAGAVHRVLALDAVTALDDGAYRCVATNVYGAAASAYGTLTVAPGISS